jgi:predicted Zn-dependent protease
MEKIRVSEVLSARRQDPYYRTHPEVGTRIGALRPRVEQISQTAQPLAPWYQSEMDLMQAKLVGFLQPRATFNKYPLTDQTIPARYARAIAAHRNHDEQSALTEIKQLIEIEPENPYFHELHGQVLYENGKIEASVAPHRKAIDLHTGHSLLYVNLAQSLIGLGTTEAYTEAEELLHQALLLEPDNAYAWRQMSYALGYLGRDAEAKLATAESAYAIGDLPRASQFAKRARDGLTENTPQWHRADDIFAVTQAQGLLAGNNRRRITDTSLLQHAQPPSFSSVTVPHIHTHPH